MLESNYTLERELGRYPRADRWCPRKDVSERGLLAKVGFGPVEKVPWQPTVWLGCPSRNRSSITIRQARVIWGVGELRLVSVNPEIHGGSWEDSGSGKPGLMGIAAGSLLQTLTCLHVQLGSRLAGEGLAGSEQRHRSSYLSGGAGSRLSAPDCTSCPSPELHKHARLTIREAVPWGAWQPCHYHQEGLPLLAAREKHRQTVTMVV